MLWLSAALLTWGIGESMFLLFQPIYLQQLGANPIQIGIILGAWGAIMTLAQIPAGHLSDRIGRRPMLIAAWMIGVAATLLMAVARSLPVFIAGIFLYGFTAFVASPLDSYTTAARGNWSVGRAITFVSMAYNAGAIIGPVTGGWLSDHYGRSAVYFAAVGGAAALIAGGYWAGAADFPSSHATAAAPTVQVAQAQAAQPQAARPAAVQTLQVGTGSTAFIPRFLPGSPSDPIWEGHLFRFDIFVRSGLRISGRWAKAGTSWPRARNSRMCFGVLER